MQEFRERKVQHYDSQERKITSSEACSLPGTVEVAQHEPPAVRVYKKLSLRALQEDSSFAATKLPKELQLLIKDYALEVDDYRQAITTIRLNINRLHACPMATIDDQHVVTVSYYNSIARIWNTSTGECVQELQEHSGNILQVIVKNNRIITGSTDGTLCIWDPITGTCIYTLYGHTGPIRAIIPIQGADFANNIASIAEDDPVIRVWDIATGTLKTRKQCSPFIAAITPCGIGNINILYQYEESSWSEIRSWNISNNTSGLYDKSSHITNIKPIRVLGKITMLIGDRTGTMRILNTEIGLLKPTYSQVLKAHTSPVHQMLILHNPLRVMTFACDDTVKLWHLTASRKPVSKNLPSVPYVYQEQRNKEFRHYPDGITTIFDPKTKTELTLLSAQEQKTRAAQEYIFSPDQQRVYILEHNQEAVATLRTLTLAELKHLKELIETLHKLTQEHSPLPRPKPFKLNKHDQLFYDKLPVSIQKCLVSHYAIETKKAGSASCAVQ